MEESINYDAIIAQLQFENEMLRCRLRPLHEVYALFDDIMIAVGRAWRAITANKSRLFVGLMLVYWALSIVLMVYDRWRPKP